MQRSIAALADGQKQFGDKIVAVDAYRADDGMAPGWRLDKYIGKAIK